MSRITSKPIVLQLLFLLVLKTTKYCNKVSVYSHLKGRLAIFRLAIIPILFQVCERVSSFSVPEAEAVTSTIPPSPSLDNLVSPNSEAPYQKFSESPVGIQKLHVLTATLSALVRSAVDLRCASQMSSSPRLLQLLTSLLQFPAVSVCTSAATIAGILAQSPHFIPLIAPLCTQLLQSLFASNEEHRVAVCETLALCMEGKEAIAIDVAMQPTILERLVLDAANEQISNPIKNACLKLIGATLKPLSPRKILQQLGALEYILPLLDNKHTRLNAAVILHRLSSDVASRNHIYASKTALKALLTIIQEAHKTFSYPETANEYIAAHHALLTLAFCALDSQGRRLVCEMNGLEQIVQVLYFYSPIILRASLWCLLRFSMDPSCATKICECGGLAQVHALCSATSSVLDWTHFVPYAPPNRCSKIEEPDYEAKHSTTWLASKVSELLEKSNTSAKYWLRGHLSCDEKIPNGFYEFGKESNFISLAVLREAAISARATTILIGYEDTKLQTCLSEARTLTSNASAEPSSPDQIIPDRVRALAIFVCNTLGGPIPLKTWSTFECELNLCKHELKSNVIPLGQLRKGPQSHRALLFKFLSDQIPGCSCTLERGNDTFRAWNCVNTPAPAVVDLLHEPGALYMLGTEEARWYTGGKM